RHAADVPALLADLADAAHLHVLDLRRIEADTLDERVQHLRGELVRAERREHAVPPADRRADGVDDEGFHGASVGTLTASTTQAGEEVCPMRKLLFLVLTAAAATALLTATGSAMTAGVRISTRKLPKLGTVLVNSKGRTLYMFVRDKRKKVTCVGSCAAAWPPVKLPKGAKAVAAGKAKAALLGSDKDPAGGRV